MLEAVIFQTQLTSIMEVLSSAAVAEITKLVDEYSAFLRAELSRKKQDNEILMNKLKEVESRHRTRTSAIEHGGDDVGAVVLCERLQSGASATSRYYLGGSLTHHTPAARKEREPDTVLARPGCCRNWGETSGTDVNELGHNATLTDRKGTPVTIKQERLEDCDDPGEYADLNGQKTNVLSPSLISSPSQMSAPEHTATPLVAGQQHPAVQACFKEDWEFRNLPSEGRNELTDSTEPNVGLGHGTLEHHVELEHRTMEHIGSGSHCLDTDQPAGLLPCLKTEPESPNLDQPPGAGPDPGINQQDLSRTYPEYAALSLGYGSYTDTPCTFFTYSPANQQHTSSTTTATSDLALLPGQHVDSVVMPGPRRDQRASGGPARRTRAPLSKDKEGRFICKDCGKGFPYVSYLRRHTLNHTGERSHHCSVCGRSFIRLSHLRRHELLHTGVRPFTCTLCGRHFSRGAHLRAHVKTHA
ncbi:zinc finger and SCAN domain-containing protein 10-like isoform X1 [Esox lucius]|uniref:zinc finger and SCAN domain-containing protein 10-like isoform X1 n=1 Tax=Esox lucius TaxID=8010 RepID=UPI0014777624|nr:zinc finger and SCAN domain-containing protein 10-like isoform X1 [Esox lucius]